MNDTVSNDRDAAGTRNKYAHLVKPTEFFRRLWNRITNDSCGEENLRAMVDDALAKGQIKAYDHAKLVEKLADRFGTPGATPKEDKPEEINEAKVDGQRTPRSRKDHYNGTEGRVRPRIMVSQPVPNIRNTGPLNVRDFRSRVVETRLVPVDQQLGNAFGSRLRISGPNRR